MRRNGCPENVGVFYNYDNERAKGRPQYVDQRWTLPEKRDQNVASDVPYHSGSVKRASNRLTTPPYSIVRRNESITSSAGPNPIVVSTGTALPSISHAKSSTTLFKETSHLSSKTISPWSDISGVTSAVLPLQNSSLSNGLTSFLNGLKSSANTIHPELPSTAPESSSTSIPEGLDQHLSSLWVRTHPLLLPVTTEICFARIHSW